MNKHDSAVAIISEIGTDMFQFCTSKRLCCWAGLTRCRWIYKSCKKYEQIFAYMDKKGMVCYNQIQLYSSNSSFSFATSAWCGKWKAVNKIRRKQVLFQKA